MEINLDCHLGEMKYGIHVCVKKPQFSSSDDSMPKIAKLLKF